VITATPSSTELVHALGATDRIVGVDEFSTYPPEVASLPKVGGFVNPSFEAIVELEPDLVILSKVQDKLEVALRASGIRTVMLDVHTIADVRAGLLTVGDALGERAAADAIVAQMDADIEAAAARGRARAQRLRVLAIIDRGRGRLGSMVAVGPGAWLDERLALVGGANALADAGKAYIKIGAEEVMRAAPDVIVETVRPGDEGRTVDWRDLPEVPAVAAGRVHELTDPIYSAPTPRIGVALRGLEQLLYGGPAHVMKPR
jgi:iron complex transport system substrate-binding protein